MSFVVYYPYFYDVNGIRIILFKLFLLAFAVFLIDGGRSFMVAGNGIEHLIVHKDNTDLEMPDTHHIVFSDDNDKWLDADECISGTIGPILCVLPIDMNFKTSDFATSIWQPPKSF